MRMKYSFTDEEPRRRILTLMIHIINALARDEGPTVRPWDGALTK